MFLTVTFAVIFAFATTSVVADDSCSNDCTGCSPVSIGAAGHWTEYYTCNDASATPLITSIDVTDADNDGDGFKIILMNKTNYDKYTKGQGYRYFAISGTGPDHSYTCFHHGAISYSAPAGTVYAVISCSNILETCHLQYKVAITCKSADPCAGVNCNNGRCSGGLCVCDSGYSGTYCEQKDCTSSCKNGFCSGETCVCNSGYSGTNCEQTDCSSSCKNGLCSGETCVCNSGYSGTNCDQSDCETDSKCNNGKCVGGSCICDSGYTGTFCDRSSNCYGTVCSYHSHISSDDKGRPWVLGLICGAIALFLVIVVVVGVVLCRRRRRRSGGIELVANEVTPQ